MLRSDRETSATRSYLLISKEDRFLDYSFSSIAFRLVSEPAKTATCFVHGL